MVYKIVDWSIDLVVKFFSHMYSIPTDPCLILSCHSATLEMN